jgi:methionyl-tRNA formyltransferase
LVSTFKQILTANVINLPALGVVNFHPSLLPKYRGACPSNAALLNDETTSGLTAHYVTEGLDDGDILLQRGFGIQEVENDGQLRYKLARLAGEITPEVIQLFSGFQKPAGKPQNHALASSAPKPAIEDGFLENARTIQELRCKVRAYNPIPGTSIFVNGRRVAVDRFELFTSRRNDGIVEKEDSIEVTLNHEAINLFIKR